MPKHIHSGLHIRKATISYDDGDGKVLLATVPPGSFVTWIGKEKPNGVDTVAYDAGTVTVGTVADPDRLMKSVALDPTGSTARVYRPDAETEGYFDTATEIYIFTSGGSQGTLKFVLKYISIH